MSRKPNILFCLADDAGMHFGAYGCSWVNTPAFDRVARDGLMFQQAYTCNAKCAPSRASILTGRNSWQLNDAANHLPLSILWPAGVKNPGRTISDMVSFIDFAPTFLEIAGVDPEEIGMAPITGHSLTDIFQSETGGVVDPVRDRILIGKERHDLGRPGDMGYPIRGLFEGDYPYLRNFEEDRWPAGNPETGYMNCDGSPTKTEILRLRHHATDQKYWLGSFGKRPAEELYNVKTDPDCLLNVADVLAFESIRRHMADRMMRELREQGDPRLVGTGTPLDENPSAETEIRNFHERFANGDVVTASWINATDIQEP